MLTVLRQRDFALLWVGGLASSIGSTMLVIALPFYVYTRTGSALATGAMFIAEMVPAVLLGSVAGVFVDRWDRQRTMIVADVSRAALLPLLLTIQTRDGLWAIYVVAAAESAISQLFAPANGPSVTVAVTSRNLWLVQMPISTLESAFGPAFVSFQTMAAVSTAISMGRVPSPALLGTRDGAWRSRQTAGRAILRRQIAAGNSYRDTGPTRMMRAGCYGVGGPQRVRMTRRCRNTYRQTDRPTDEMVAFGLGWHVAELYHSDRLPGEEEPGEVDSLPGIGRLPREARADLLVQQIAAEVERVTLDRAAVGERDAWLRDGRIDADALKLVVRRDHEALLKTLTARVPRLGTAYGLGRALAETMLLPQTQEPVSFRRPFSPYRLGTLKDQLADVQAALPPYVAEAVGQTLDAWARWVTGAVQGGTPIQWTTAQKREVGQNLRRQGEVWYGLLTGQMDPLRLLRLEDYDAAATSLLRSVGALAWEFVTATWIGRVLGLVAIVIGLALLAIAVTGQGAALAGVAVLWLGELGITAGSVAAAVRQTLRQARLPLWDAALARGIGSAARHTPRSLRPGDAGAGDAGDTGTGPP